MTMEFRTLELNIISAKDLKDVNLFSKMDVYAVVSLSGDSLHPQTTKTPVHRGAGTNPTWNFPVKFTINETLAKQNLLSIEIKLISDRTLGDTVIGTVHVPLKNKTVSPSKSSGKSKGTFNFSYKFGVHVEAPAMKSAAKTTGKQESGPIRSWVAWWCFGWDVGWRL